MPGYDNDESSLQPLLGINIISNTTSESESAFASGYARKRRQVRALLSTNAKHYTVMGLVALDVGAILADIFVAFVACDLHLEDEEWVGRTREGLRVVALVFSSVFLAELLVTVWAFGRRFFHDWFHCFDGFIIVASFVIDVITRGIVEEISSMIIILRLWRFVKIVEELSLGASERMEEVEARVADLERENLELKSQVETLRDGAWRG